MSCHRKYQLAHICGIVSSARQKPLLIGKASHEALDLRAKGDTPEIAIQKALVKHYDTEIEATEIRGEFELGVELFYEKRFVGAMMTAYFWRWANEDADIEYLHTEMKSTVALRNPATGRRSRTFEIPFVVDKVIRHKPTNIRALMEHKTAGAVDDMYWDRLKIDPQITVYYDALNHMKIPVSTVLYDVIVKLRLTPKQVPDLDKDGLKIVVDAEGVRQFKSVKKGDGTPAKGDGEPYQGANAEKGWVIKTRPETPDEYGQRVLDTYVAKWETCFYRRFVEKTPRDISEAYTDIWHTSKEIGEATRLNRFQRNPYACTAYGGCRYFNLCTKGFQPGDILPEGFTMKTTRHDAPVAEVVDHDDLVEEPVHGE